MNIDEIPRTFNEFYNKYFTIGVQKEIENLFKVVGKSISDKEIKQIVNNLICYPYTYTSFKIFMALFYRHIFLKREIKEGDYYDQFYLIYLTKLDYLVSNDGGLKKIAEDVFDNSKKVITFNELVSLLPK